MVQPGAVVYTAALAECRWAGEQRHVDYLLQEMEAEGLRIVPGVGNGVFEPMLKFSHFSAIEMRMFSVNVLNVAVDLTRAPGSTCGACGRRV